MKNIAVFASGSGTNTEEIIKYFKNKNDVTIKIICSNNKNAYVIKRAENNNIKYRVFDRNEFYETDNILELLINNNVDLIVLSGFLWLIPKNIISKFNNQIINIHPALLPKYGGKGMYGNRVHETVINNNEKESGITIHFVNEKYDDGDIIFQAKTSIEFTDTPETLAQKIHKLEYKHFPKIIENVLHKL